MDTIMLVWNNVNGGYFEIICAFLFVKRAKCKVSNYMLIFVQLLDSMNNFVQLKEYNFHKYLKKTFVEVHKLLVV